MVSPMLNRDDAIVMWKEPALAQEVAGG